MNGKHTEYKEVNVSYLVYALMYIYINSCHSIYCTYTTLYICVYIYIYIYIYILLLLLLFLFGGVLSSNPGT